MKRNIITVLCALGLGAVAASCDKTDGALYSGDANKVSFLSASTSLNMEGGTLSIPVGRTSSSGELAVPVTLTATGEGYTDVFKVDGPIQFANGQGKSYAKVNYGDFSVIDPSALSVSAAGLDVNVGLAFPVSLKIEDDLLSPTKIGSVNVLASSRLGFEPVGTATINSVEGWEGAELTCEVHKAIGANVYKLIGPFGFNNFAFMIKSDGKTVICPNQVIYNHSTYGPVTMGGVTGTVEDGKIILEVTGYTVSAGSFGGGVEIITLPDTE